MFPDFFTYPSDRGRPDSPDRRSETQRLLEDLTVRELEANDIRKKLWFRGEEIPLPDVGRIEPQQATANHQQLVGILKTEFTEQRCQERLISPTGREELLVAGAAWETLWGEGDPPPTLLAMREDVLLKTEVGLAREPLETLWAALASADTDMF